MAFITEEMIKQLQTQMEKIDEHLKITFLNVHNGYQRENLLRFLKARDENVFNAQKMLIDCLNWRVENGIDDILTKPITSTDVYRSIRNSQLVGMSGHTKEGLPVIAIGVGLSTFDNTFIHYYVQSHIQMNEYRDRVILPCATKKYGRYIGTCVKILDMTGLRLSALNQIELLSAISTIDDLNYPEKTETYYIVNAPYIFSSCWKVVRPLLQERTRKKVQLLSGSGRDELLKLLSAISTIDDLNYPEKTETYYIVNAPYIFSSCWKVVRPLLQERTRKKVQLLSGSGRDELLKIMDYESLPHFCRKEGSGSSRHSKNGTKFSDCYSLDHPFHQQLYNYIKEQALSVGPPASVHVDFPEPDAEDVNIAQTIESEFQRIGNQNGVCHELKIAGD